MGNKNTIAEKDSKEEQTYDFSTDPLLSPLFNYYFANRKCEYGEEQLEISPQERILLEQLIQIAALNNEIKMKDTESGGDTQNSNFQNKLNDLYNKNSGRMKIIIDTDIGTDIDDVLALLCALKTPKEHLNILGITTNYHPTHLRARVAQEILNATGPPSNKIPVIPGSSFLCGSHRGFFHHGNEGKGLFLDTEEIDELWQPCVDSEASQFIYGECKKYPGEVTIVSIGIPTNIGFCAYKYKDFGGLVGHIVVMGGGSIIYKEKAEVNHTVGKYSADSHLWSKSKKYYSSDSLPFPIPKTPKSIFINTPTPFYMYPNHNLSGDTLASTLLFNKLEDTPITLIPHEITSKFWLSGVSILTLLNIGSKSHPQPHKNIYRENSPGGRLLHEWLSRRWGQMGQCPHDPLTLYEAVYPLRAEGESFQGGRSALRYINGTLVVHQWAAFSTFVPDGMGKHRIAVGVLGGWLGWLEDTLLVGIASDEWVY